MRTIIEWIKGVWHILAVTWDRRPRPFEAMNTRALFALFGLGMFFIGVFAGLEGRYYLAMGVAWLISFCSGVPLLYRARQYERSLEPYYEALIETANGSELVVGLAASSRIPEVEQWIEDGRTPLEAWEKWFHEIYTGRWRGTRVVIVREKMR